MVNSLALTFMYKYTKNYQDASVNIHGQCVHLAIIYAAAHCATQKLINATNAL